MKDGKIIYTDGNVIVNDYNPERENIIETEIRKYQDNIEEIIKIENIIEELTNMKKELSEKKFKTIDYIKDTKKSIIKLSILTLIALCLTIGIFMYGIRGNVLLQYISAMGIITTIIVGGFSAIDIKTYKTLKKNLAGSEIRLEELEKELINNKNCLYALNNEKSKKMQEEAEKKKYSNIHNIHIEQLNKIKEYLSLYYIIGKNKENFLNYYNKGTLDNELEEKYSEDEIKTIKTYLKKKK